MRNYYLYLTLKYYMLIHAVIILICLNACNSNQTNSQKSKNSNNISSVKNTPINSNIEQYVDSRDGNSYLTVKIGNQVWFAENLRYKASSGNWVYNNDQNNEATYGRLYNWKTACEVCPDGWHLPSDNEWKELEKFLGMTPSDADLSLGTGSVKPTSRGSVEDGKLKETGTKHWMETDYCVTNEIKFTALPGGMRFINGEFDNKTSAGFWWSSTEYNDLFAFYRAVIIRDCTIIRNDNGNKKAALSVRCIKD